MFIAKPVSIIFHRKTLGDLSLRIFLNLKTIHYLVLMLQLWLNKNIFLKKVNLTDFSKVLRHVNHLQWAGTQNCCIWFFKVYCILIENMVLGYHSFWKRSVDLNKSQTTSSVADRACSFIAILPLAERGRSIRSKEAAKSRFIPPDSEQLGCPFGSHLGPYDPFPGVFSDLDNFSITS